MKRIIPSHIYEGQPCSVVAVGCAMGLVDGLGRLVSPDLHDDGYLSLNSMNRLIRANLIVNRQVKFKKGERPVLRDWAHENLGKRAVVCVLGHFLFFDGRDYHSFFWNGGDEVVCVWYLA
jgi:hypothetical protein